MVIPIKNLLSGSIQRSGVAPQVEASLVCEEFNKIALEILGENIRDKVKALYIKNNTLSIAVMSSALGQEIKLHELEILQKLNQKTGQNKVERLRFLV